MTGFPARIRSIVAAAGVGPCPASTRGSRPGTRTIAATGPKVSSQAQAMVASASASTVGA